MKSLLSFTIEHFLLFEATLLQYAYFTSAQSQAQGQGGNLSCTGCVIHAGPQTLLSFTGNVQETVTSQSVTVIPYITVFDNGNVTNWSTYTVYNSGSPTEGLASAPPLLTWETLGTTLTYPTTYVAFPDISAGTSRKAQGSCASASLAEVPLQPTDQARLIFPTSSGKPFAEITQSVSSIMDSLPGISALVSPFPPSRCSKGFERSALGELTATKSPGAPGAEPPQFTATSAAEAIIHTSVRYLTTQGPPQIIKRTGNAPPPEQQTTPPPNGGGKPPSNGGQGGNNNQQPPPTITWGGFTYTGKSGGGWNFGGGADLTPGGPAQTIGGTTVSVADGGSVVFNGQTTTPGGAAQSSGGAAEATGGADVKAPGSPVTWAAGGAIGVLGMVVGIWL